MYEAGMITEGHPGHCWPYIALQRRHLAYPSLRGPMIVDIDHSASFGRGEEAAFAIVIPQ